MLTFSSCHHSNGLWTIRPILLADSFQRDGIVVLHDFFDSDPMRRLASELAATIATDPDRTFGGGPEFAQQRECRVQVWSGKELLEVRRTMRDPRLAAITEAILSPDHLAGGEGVFSTPTGGGQAWHQDSRVREPKHFELNRIVFSSDVSAEQGGLLCMPGSHLGPNLPRRRLQTLVPADATLAHYSTLVLMHTRCYHAVEVNRIANRRAQCNSRMRPATAPDNLGNFPVFRTGPWNFKAGRAE